MKRKFGMLAAPLAIGAMALTLPVTAAASPASASGVTNNATDLGPTAAATTITASIIFRVHDQSGLENYIQQTVTPDSPMYHKFLSVNQFRAHYAPSVGEIHQVAHYLQSYGLTVNETYQDDLVMKVTGTVDQFNQAFNTEIHDYSKEGKKYRAPKKTPKLPSVIADSVLAVAGISTQALSRPMSKNASQVTDNVQQPTVLPKDGTATGIPGEFTVGDAANLYDVNPLYQKGVSGAGSTIGIATLAGFHPEDAYTYWDAIGLRYKADRIAQVHVDGGGEMGADAGSGETTLDVEQSGGLAPNANIVVYDAPNTDAGFLDVFYKAVSDNIVDSLSVSWGEPEIFYTSALNGGVDYTNELTAFNQAFMEGAAQGITMFAASGDSGAYDTNRSFSYPYFSKTLTVDSPASAPYITAAGGTTVPATIQMKHDRVTVSQERPWAWDYMNDYLVKYYGPSAKDMYFSVGGGGGVSTLWALPWYQSGIPGMQSTAPDQAFVDNTGTIGWNDPLPANFAGRNVPDISMNADPETGYLLYSTEDGGWIGRYGGTSFVAPQLNGVTALMDQYVGQRVGFLNPTLYRLQQSDGYGSNTPFNAISTGDNWYYQANGAYNPAIGIGTPNAANLADAILADSRHKH